MGDSTDHYFLLRNSTITDGGRTTFLLDAKFIVVPPKFFNLMAEKLVLWGTPQEPSHAPSASVVEFLNFCLFLP